MLKKHWLMVILVLVVVSLLAACGGSTPTVDTSELDAAKAAASTAEAKVAEAEAKAAEAEAMVAEAENASAEELAAAQAAVEAAQAEAETAKAEAEAALAAAAEPEEEMAEDEQITLQFWTWFPPLPTTEKMIAAFEEEHPNIDVEITILESTVYQDTMPLSLVGGEQMDVVAIQTSSMVNQVKADLSPLEPLLNEYVGSDWADMVNPTAIEQGKILADDGELYILPMGSLGSVVGFYNVEMFEEYGLEVPTTNAELKEFADSLAAQNPDILPVVFTGANWFQDEILLTQMGQTYPEFYDEIRYGDGRWDDPAFVEGLENYKQMFDDGLFSLDVVDLDYGRSLELFYTGDAAILLQGTWEAGVLSTPFREEKGIDLADVGLMPLPLVDESGTPSIRSFIELGLSVPQSSEHPEEAMMLIEYLILGEGVDVWGPALITVPSLNGYEFSEDVLASDAAKEGYATLVDLVENPSSDRNNTPFSQVVGDAIISVLNGQDAQEAAEGIQAEWESGRYNN